MAFTVGIDVGSGFSKAVVCEDGAIRAYAVAPSGGDYRQAAERVTEEALKNAGVSRDTVSRIGATGYGAGMVSSAQATTTDISCHALGVHHLLPSVRTVIDVGAQFSKAIRVDAQGKVGNFVMNEKCAGGSGKFLSVISRILQVDLDAIGPLSLRSVNPVQFTTGCAVFAESEVVSRIAEGTPLADIVAGVHKAMASKIVNLVVRLGLQQDCAVTGGGAKDAGLVKTLGAELGVPVMVPDEPRITAALGAALLALNGVIE